MHLQHKIENTSNHRSAKENTEVYYAFYILTLCE